MAGAESPFPELPDDRIGIYYRIVRIPRDGPKAGQRRIVALGLPSQAVAQAKMMEIAASFAFVANRYSGKEPIRDPATGIRGYRIKTYLLGDTGIRIQLPAGRLDLIIEEDAGDEEPDDALYPG
jgi:hypothetical protein